MDTQKLGNGKYFSGNYTEAGKDHRGWFLGSFFEDGHPCKTEKIEVLFMEHKPGDKCKKHYHRKKIELIIVLEGKARYFVNEKEVMLNKGDFLFLDVNNITEGEFLEPTKIFAVHSPSIPDDKVSLG